MNIKRNYFIYSFLFFTFLINIQKTYAQEVLLQGWYWDYPKPFPCDTLGIWSADTLNPQIGDLAAAGFTHIWLPPLSRASFGACSNGYDPQDLYDLGEYGQGTTGFGTRAQVDALIANINSSGMEAVADVVYNHRDGGDAEDNQAVKDYITMHYNAAKNAFPSDRFRCILPLGGASGNNEGDYYFKISSKSGDTKFYNKAYTLYIETGTVTWQNLSDLTESEPNGGGDCSQAFNTAELGRNMIAAIDDVGCTVDEFKVTLNTGDFNPAGDTLFIYMAGQNGDYSDHRVYGLWDATDAMDIVDDLIYQTYTDFTNMPSGQGSMNFENFKPNTNNTATTYLDGDWDWLWFFYDYDQYSTDTQNKLFEWTKWLWEDVDIRGFRMDAVKHFDPAFVGDLMDYMHDQSYDPGMVVGEFYDANAFNLKNWVTDVYSAMDTDTKSAINIRVFDFALRRSLKDACDAFGYDARNVFNSGVVDEAGDTGFNVVTFINNHDFRDEGQPVENDVMLAYAYLLTNNKIGTPSVFYPDYAGSVLPHGPAQKLKPEIDELIRIHGDYIFGSSSVDYLSRIGTPYSATYSTGFDNTTLFYQLSGGNAGREVIVAINFAGEPLELEHQLNMTNLVTNDTLWEVTNNSSATYTVLAGDMMEFEIPARSYAVWVNGNCHNQLTINDQPVEDGSYKVTDKIFSAGQVDIGSNVIYNAGNEIDLLPGFEANANSTFCAEIKTCTF